MVIINKGITVEQKKHSTNSSQIFRMFITKRNTLKDYNLKEHAVRRK